MKLGRNSREKKKRIGRRHLKKRKKGRDWRRRKKSNI